MKKTTTIIVMLILFFLQWKQISISYANEHEVNDGEDTSISNDIMPFSKPEFYTIQNDTGITIAAYLWGGGHVDIPAVINGQPVTIIGESSFFNKNVTSVTIPDSVTKIGDRAFLMNQLTTVTIPNSVESIGNLAFFNNQLTMVDIPDSVKKIGSESFANNQLTSVTLPDGITRIENGVFTKNKLESVVIPSSVTSIGNYAFYQNLLTTIILPDDLTSIGNYTFYGNSLKDVTIPEAVTHIGDWTFAYNQLQWVRFYHPLVLQPNTFGNQGSTFDGWYKDLVWATPWDGNITQPTRIYAKGNALTYTLMFDTNGGTALDEQKILAGEKASAPAAPIKKGSLFVGWYKDEELTVPWNFDTDVVTEHLTLYGKWTKKPHTVVFHTDPDITTVEVLDGELLTKPLDPTKAGYTFLGWYKDEEFSSPWDFAVDKVMEDISLYAKWLKNTYTVQFRTDFESIVSYVRYGDKLEEPVPLRNIGHTFTGWYKDKEFTALWNFAEDKVTEDIMLYGQWVKNIYTVQFQTNFELLTSNVQYGDRLEKPISSVKAGYTFTGWYKDKELTIPWNFEIDKVTEPLTLYGKWTANDYTITFQVNGGTAIPPITAIYNQQISKPAAPTKAGHAFVGWYKDAQFTTPWNFNTDVVTANLTLYAKWLANSSSGGGGSGNPTPTPTEPIPKEPTPAPEQPEPIPEEPAEPQLPEPTPQPEVAISFSDISQEHWAWTMIQEMAKKSIITGYPDGTFQPNAPIQRQHVALMLTRALKLEPKKEALAFHDIPEGHRYFEVINQVQQAGLFDGIDGSFQPTANMTRAQMAKVLVLAFDLTADEKEAFNDVPPTHWAYDYIAILAANGITIGDQGNFRPNDPVTRAEFATFLYRALKL